MIARNPVKHPRGLTQFGKPPFRSVEQIGHRLQIACNFFAALHRLAARGEFFLLARLGGKRGQFAHRMVQPFAVARRGIQLGTRAIQRGLGSVHCPVRDGDRRGIDPPECI